MQNFLSGHAIQYFSACLYEPVNILAVYPYGPTEPERDILRLGLVAQRISIGNISFVKPAVFPLFQGKEKAPESCTRILDASCFIPQLIVATNALCRHKRRVKSSDY